MLQEHEIEVRVRYQETDGQGRLHHANYFTYFELGRTELLRAAGYNYRQIESEGWMLVVSQITCQYYQPANYDDLLRLRTTVVEARGRAWSTNIVSFAATRCWPRGAASWPRSIAKAAPRGCPPPCCYGRLKNSIQPANNTNNR